MPRGVRPAANDETFGILDFGGFRLAGVGVEEKPTTPHARLGCIHLQSSFLQAPFGLSTVQTKVAARSRAHNKNRRATM